MSILDGLESSAQPPEDQEFLAPDEGFSSEFPGLYEFLARIKYHGQTRKPGKMIVYYEENRAAICLSDVQTRQVGFHIGESIQECMEGLEGRLQACKVDWRRSRKWQG
jgi:hypothetical protein